MTSRASIKDSLRAPGINVNVHHLSAQFGGPPDGHVI
jgi:hypothetical protein